MLNLSCHRAVKLKSLLGNDVLDSKGLFDEELGRLENLLDNDGLVNFGFFVFWENNWSKSDSHISSCRSGATSVSVGSLNALRSRLEERNLTVDIPNSVSSRLLAAAAH